MSQMCALPESSAACSSVAAGEQAKWWQQPEAEDAPREQHRLGLGSSWTVDCVVRPPAPKGTSEVSVPRTDDVEVHAVVVDAGAAARHGSARPRSAPACRRRGSRPARRWT